MREPAPDYSANQYERPNRPWVCGLAADGHACSAGPTARGRCPALAECAPIRDGDRWQCNRSGLRGGPCDEGPTPEGDCGCVHKCRPVRSLRAKRGQFIAACAVLTLGSVCIVLSANWRNRIVRPGPLAQQHAQLLERVDGGTPNCGACHTAAAKNVAGWAASLVVTDDHQPTQSQLCMNCHVKTIAASLAFTAHNVPAHELERVTNSRKLQPADVHTVSSESLPSKDRNIACARCHREHHGARADLTAIDNAACQTCHQQRYRSFATDHPDFGQWPYERRTRIVFDHALHQGKHFPEKKKSFDCRACHVSDASGAVERTVSYEKSCASCHDEKIATSVGRGVPMFVLPTLDVEAMKKAGHDIGAWPKGATGDFDGRLTLTMKVLLSADPAAAKAMAKLGIGFEFQDIDPANAGQLAASADLATAIKKLLTDIGRRGTVAVRERLSAALGRQVSEAEVALLTAGMPRDFMRAAADWIGSSTATASQTEGPPKVALAKVTSPFGPSGAWSRNDATYTIRYLPAVHTDPVLGGWLALLTNTPRLESHPVAMAMLKESTKTTSPGLCASCHSAERSAAGAVVINWKAYDRTVEPCGFTKFAHRPHLVLPQLTNCESCHAIDGAINTAASYADWNPQRFVTEFKPLTKRQCAECHTKSAAGNRCQSCHNYHVEEVESWRLSAPMAGWHPAH